MAKIVTLKSPSDEDIYPVTDASGIRVTGNVTLQQALDSFVYADDPTAPANPDAWITSSDINWGTIKKTLYTGPSGTSGSFQLSETAANFDALIIKYRRGTNGNTTKTDTIWDPDGTSYQLLTSAADNSVFTFYGGRIGISGTTVTWQAGSAVAFNSNGQAGFGSSNELVILSVVGIKLG